MATRAYFSVENYQGSKVAQRRETRSIDEAYRWAKETPESSVAVLDGKGWVKGWSVFSAKHPPNIAAIRSKVKTHFKRGAARTNPSKPAKRAVKKAAPKTRSKTFAIYASKSAKSPRMHFDGKNFSQRSTIRRFPSVAIATKKARELIAKHPVLRKYRVTVEPPPRPL